MRHSKLSCFAAVIGTVIMILLRFYDRAGILSAALVTAGMIGFIYSIRHAASAKEYVFIAAVMEVTFAARIYGYTGDALQDIILGLIIGIIMFVLFGIERLFKRYETNFWYTFIFPAVYMLFMYFTEIVKINMPFRMDVYLSGIQVICQITSVFGTYSLDFLLGWTASAAVFFIDSRVYKQKKILAIMYAAVITGVVCFGISHMNMINSREKNGSDIIRVACVTGPYCGTISDDCYTQFTTDQTMAAFNEAVEDAAEKDAEILLFSEEAYDIPSGYEDTLLSSAKNLADKYDMHIVLAYEMGPEDSASGKHINKLCWISNDGEIIYDYVKHCIVPIVETSEFVSGEKYIESFVINVHGSSLRVATAICYDADFDVFMSHMGRNVDLLLLPTWDWKVIAQEHLCVARLRAIASRTTVVRSVYDGWNAVIDSAGNILDMDNTNITGYGTVLVYDVPIH